MIRSSLRQYLASLLSDLVGQRIYPLVLPQNVSLPAILYSRVTGGHDHNLAGSAGSSIAAFELRCLASSYAQADDVAEAVRQKLQGFRGMMDDTKVSAVLLDDEVDSYEPPDDASDSGIFVITLRYRIRYVESVPSP